MYFEFVVCKKCHDDMKMYHYSTKCAARKLHFSGLIMYRK